MTLTVFFRLLPLTLTLVAAGLSQAQPTSGLDTAGFDKSVRAQDDLFRAANGQWLAQTKIPADKSRYGSFDQLSDLSDQRVRGIVDALTGKPQKVGTSEQKVADFYRAFNNTTELTRPVSRRLPSSWPAWMRSRTRPSWRPGWAARKAR